MDESTNTEHSEMSAEQQTDIQAKCEEYLAGWKRAQADYLNLQKTIERERQEWTKFANERLLSELLPAIDQFEMALSFTPDCSELPQADRKKLENWINGLRAVQSGWSNAFAAIGLEHITTDGAFDPMLHEAVGEEIVEGGVSGTITKTIQSGWRLNGKVLRPAKVILTK